MAILRRLGVMVGAIFCLWTVFTVGGSASAQTPLNDNLELTGIAERARANLSLTEAEKSWLSNHRVIRVGIDADYEPYSFVEDGVFRGIVPDYLSVMGAVLGVRFDGIPDLSWSDILEKARSRDIDMIATAARLKKREAYLDFTDFVLPTPIVIMSRENQKAQFSDPSGLAGRKLALVRGYAAGQRVMADHPDAIAMMYDTPREALIAVASGEADAYVGVLATNAYLVRKHGLGNLVVASRYDDNVDGQRFAIRND